MSSNEPEIRLAYLFWFASWFGFAGLHRFYLGKPVSGLLYLVTWGFGGIGTIYDAMTMPRLVHRARLERRVERVLDEETRSYRIASPPPRYAQPRESIEHAILRIANENHGIVTPSKIALERNISVEAAKAELERLNTNHICEMRVTRSGVIVYAFHDFLDDEGRSQLEDF